MVFCTIHLEFECPLQSEILPLTLSPWKAKHEILFFKKGEGILVVVPSYDEPVETMNHHFLLWSFASNMLKLFSTYILLFPVLERDLKNLHAIWRRLHFTKDVQQPILMLIADFV